MPSLAFSPMALVDLREIGAYIARGSPDRAASFIHELEVQCKAVAASPSIYPARFDLAAGLRMAPYGQYLVLFRELREIHTVRIERVLHGARNLPALFDDS